MRPDHDKAPSGAFHGPVVFVSGFAVLSLEILSSRLIAPTFGGTVYVWASLLTVTLLALGLGYYLGGMFADRLQPRQVLQHVLGLSAILFFSLPYYVEPIREASAHLGVRVGSLVVSGILVGPPLLLLGSVIPLCLRLRVRTLGRVGREFGGLSAWSTAGSVLGALCTGFFLLEWLSSRDILHALAAALAATVGLLFFQPGSDRRTATYRALAVFAVAVLCAALSTRDRHDRVKQGDNVYLHSKYGEVRIEDDTRSGTRTLYLDGLPNSRVLLADMRTQTDIIHAFELRG